jgi:hypothetical protein
MGSNMEVPQKTKSGTTTPLLCIYLKECAPGYDRANCTHISIAALFTIAKLWKKPRNPTTDEWIKNVVYIYSGILFSH